MKAAAKQYGESVIFWMITMLCIAASLQLLTGWSFGETLDVVLRAVFLWWGSEAIAARVKTS